MRAPSTTLDVVPALTLWVEFLRPAVWCGCSLWWKVVEGLCAAILRLHLVVVSPLFLLFVLVDLLLDEIIRSLKICIHGGSSSEINEVLDMNIVLKVESNSYSERPTIYILWLETPGHGTRQPYFAERDRESLIGQATCRRCRKPGNMAVQQPYENHRQRLVYE